MVKLEIAALYVGLNIILLAYLGVRIANFRRTNRIGIGDGGNADLTRMIRVHGNAAEYIPAGAIGLLFLALLPEDLIPAWFVHTAGIALTAGRVLHAWGLGAEKQPPHIGRVGGMMLTLLALLLCGGGMIWAALRPVI